MKALCRLMLALTVSFMLLPGSSRAQGVRPTRQCLFNSDCMEPLVCHESLGYCMAQCRTDRDCARDETCQTETRQRAGAVRTVGELNRAPLPEGIVQAVGNLQDYEVRTCVVRQLASAVPVAPQGGTQGWAQPVAAGGARDEAWSAWAGGRARVSGQPAVVGTAAGLQVLAMGADGTLMARALDGGAWGPWVSLGGTLRSEPSAVAFGSRVEAYVRGSDDAAWVATIEGGAVRWDSLGGVVASAPVAAATGKGDDVAVLIVGVDGAAWRNGRADGKWSGWQPVGK